MASPPPDSGALALYSEKNAAYAALSTEQRIALLQESRIAAETEEERLKRQEEAEALEAKLRHIIEEVPDREYNLKGSMAGANSMTFDRYRSAKRREELRVAAMEEAERKKEAKRKFEEEVGGKNAAEAKKTEKRRYVFDVDRRGVRCAVLGFSFLSLGSLTRVLRYDRFPGRRGRRKRRGGKRNNAVRRGSRRTSSRARTRTRTRCPCSNQISTRDETVSFQRRASFFRLHNNYKTDRPASYSVLNVSWILLSFSSSCWNSLVGVLTNSAKTFP